MEVDSFIHVLVTITPPIAVAFSAGTMTGSFSHLQVLIAGELTLLHHQPVNREPLAGTFSEGGPRLQNAVGFDASFPVSVGLISLYCLIALAK